MADDPTRTEALRAAGIAAKVDTEDPPGKVTVVLDLADFDTLTAALIDGRPNDVTTARAQGYAQGREDAEAVAAANARAQVARDLIAQAARGDAALRAAVAALARQHNVPETPVPPVDPAVKAALVGDGPDPGPMGKARTRT